MQTDYINPLLKLRLSPHLIKTQVEKASICIMWVCESQSGLGSEYGLPQRDAAAAKKKAHYLKAGNVETKICLWSFMFLTTDAPTRRPSLGLSV